MLQCRIRFQNAFFRFVITVMEYLKRFQTQDLDFTGQVTGILSNAQGMSSVVTLLYGMVWVWYQLSGRFTAAAFLGTRRLCNTYFLFLSSALFFSLTFLFFTTSCFFSLPLFFSPRSLLSLSTLLLLLLSSTPLL
mgnify:CR=1 FL=1